MIIAGTGIAGAPSTSSDIPGWVRFDGGVITEVGVGDTPPEAAESVDLGDVVLAPGFIDLQINGIEEIDFGATSASGAREALTRLARTGCTTCLPTLVTAPDAAYGPMLDVIAAASALGGAETRCQVAGVHLEGPFLGGAPGAHPRDLVRAVDIDALAAWVDRHRDLVRLVTIAPEADRDFTAIRWLRARGITVAVGHTDADFAHVGAAFAAGASMATHLFNGMAPFHHRDPGPVGAAFAAPSVTASLIADGVHVHPAVAAMAIAAKTNIALVTDAVAIHAGSAGGVQLRQGVDGAAHLLDGTLAGSSLTLDHALRNVVAWGIGLDRAIDMVTAVPAAAIGLRDRGVLDPGRRADVVAIDRVSLQVRGVWIAGRRVA